MVRIDPVDPRFATGVEAGKPTFYWPIGLNIRSIYDTRSHGNKNFKTILSQDRGAHAYTAFLRRLAAAGGTAIEIWMASWNLALEWREEWPGYHGLGSYHNQANAARGLINSRRGLPTGHPGEPGDQ